VSGPSREGSLPLPVRAKSDDQYYLDPNYVPWGTDATEFLPKELPTPYEGSIYKKKRTESDVQTLRALNQMAIYFDKTTQYGVVQNWFTAMSNALPSGSTLKDETWKKSQAYCHVDPKDTLGSKLASEIVKMAARSDAELDELYGTQPDEQGHTRGDTNDDEGVDKEA
jgi:hypothetical protein